MENAKIFVIFRITKKKAWATPYLSK